MRISIIQALTIPVTTTPTIGPFTLSATSVSYTQGDTTLSKTFTVTADDDADARQTTAWI